VCLFIIIVKVVLSYNLFVTFVLLVSYSIVEGVFFFNLFWFPVMGSQAFYGGLLWLVLLFVIVIPPPESSFWG